MKNSVIILIIQLWFSMLCFSQTEKKLRIPFGQTITINETETIINELIMENNSIIKLQGIQNWTLNARTARIGEGCKILGTAKNGDNGQPGSKGGDASKDCKPGSTGINGEHGKKGENGINVNIYMEIIELGELTIDTRGGQGGNGGNGGDGGNGGKADISDNCRGGAGGDGGIGGNSGQGGNGGNIIFEYSIRGKTPLFNRSQKFNSVITNMDAGTNGKVGSAGEGGKGGDSVSRRACSFCPKISKGGGPNGSRGESGINPNSSINGKLTTNAIDRGDCLDDLNKENYAIIIAISESDNGEGDNEVFVEDAKRLVKVLEENYSFDEVVSYYNIKRRQLEDILATLRHYGEESRIFMYLSGHGLEYNGFPSFSTSDNYPMPFKSIYSYVEDASVDRLLLMVDACYSGKIFDNKYNPIEAYTPHKSRLIHARETCDKKALTVISSGFDDETVPARDFINELIYKLESNDENALTAELLFHQLIRTDFKAQKPVFGKSKNCSQNQCIESDFIFFKK